MVPFSLSIAQRKEAFRPRLKKLEKTEHMYEVNFSIDISEKLGLFIVIYIYLSSSLSCRQKTKKKVQKDK